MLMLAPLGSDKNVFVPVAVFVARVSVWLVGLTHIAVVKSDERPSSGKEQARWQDGAGAANVSMRAKQARGEHAKC